MCLKCLNPENVLSRESLHVEMELGGHEMLDAVGKQLKCGERLLEI